MPRGDNDRVSLHYEAARFGDIDVVRGSEVPPRQSRVALRWWLHAAAIASRVDAPRYIALSYDSVLLSLPRLALRMRELAQAMAHVPRAASSSTPGELVYAGSMHWMAWMARGGRRGGTWRCVRGAAPPPLVNARLAGEASLPPKPLNTAARQRAARAPACGAGTGAHAASAGTPPAFLAATPELQVLSGPLLLRVRAPLQYGLRTHELDVTPPPELWEHQASSGRTPSQPAVLAATALAWAVQNASRHAGTFTYFQLHGSTELPAFDWGADPRVYPGARALLARGVTDGAVAEAVVERFARQRAREAGAAGHVRCRARSICRAWGVPDEAAGAPVCCEESGADRPGRAPCPRRAPGGLR